MSSNDMRPRSYIPIRIGGSRTRFGCLTCKQRHIKCTLEHPLCGRCRRSNRVCRYDVLPTPYGSTTASPTPDAVLPLQPARGSLFDRGLHELNVLHEPSSSAGAGVGYFATHLGTELAGNFSNTLWCDILPRVAQHEPSIWHAINAVSAMDIALQSHDNAIHHDLAITHYSKALQYLRLHMDSPTPALSKDVILLACIVFAVFECLQTHLNSALRHISGGLQLWTEWADKIKSQAESTPTNTYLNLSTLQAVLLCLNSQALQLGVEEFRATLSVLQRVHISNSVPRFTSLDDAHVFLSQIFHRLSHWDNFLDQEILMSGDKFSDWRMTLEREQIKAQLVAWDVEFRRVSGGSEAMAVYHLLLAHRKLIGMMYMRIIEDPNSGDEAGWDGYQPVFEEVLAHIEEYTSLTEVKTPPRHANRPKLVIAMDVVLPLFFISRRCRHPVTRREALKLLERCNCKEGIWNSAQCAKVVEMLIQMEEQAFSVDEAGNDSTLPPNNARIGVIDVSCAADDEEGTSNVSITMKRESELRPHQFVV